MYLEKKLEALMFKQKLLFFTIFGCLFFIQSSIGENVRLLNGNAIIDKKL